MNNANTFKSKEEKVTEYHVRQIVSYIIYCYLQILADKKTYDYSEKGKIAKEEFLRNGLVNDYLQKSYNKKYYKQYISDNPSVEITFHPEETMTYNDSETQILSTDKIDISIWENSLQAIWSEKSDNEIRFAVECKRIKKLSDALNYISDTENFCFRNYVNTRLAFEGQIAFIEDIMMSCSKLKEKINEILLNHETIITSQFLEPVVLNDKFEGTYLSKHLRVSNKQYFSVYHLFFDYSSIVVN
ncbi:MAG: hypothetical protein FWG98_05960 [Candidatus Cloacimonetes bacterium]|nr:hypothetical protein [Candidatus Cloacimonadota bacterium]